MTNHKAGSSRQDSQRDEQNRRDNTSSSNSSSGYSDSSSVGQKGGQAQSSEWDKDSTSTKRGESGMNEDMDESNL